MTEFRTSFEVTATPAEAWKALDALQHDHERPAGRWWLPGFEGTGTEVEAVAEHRLTVRKDKWPCPGTLITITFDHVATGTRVTVVQSGFDEAFVAAAGESFWIVAEHIAADLRLFFATGILGGRHKLPWVSFGCDVVATPVGLEVTRIDPSGWAERAGVAIGDVLLTIGGAPVTTMRDFVTLGRVLRTGATVAATWAHDGQRVEASAAL
jgi:hypothetical protein